VPVTRCRAVVIVGVRTPVTNIHCKAVISPGQEVDSGASPAIIAYTK
jgi:hypothetical protein